LCEAKRQRSPGCRWLSIEHTKRRRSNKEAEQMKQPDFLICYLIASAISITAVALMAFAAIVALKRFGVI